MSRRLIRFRDRSREMLQVIHDIHLLFYHVWGAVPLSRPGPPLMDFRADGIGPGEEQSGKRA